MHKDNPVPSLKNILYSLHKFNKLDNRIVSILGNEFNVNAEEICNINGIVYNIEKNGVETAKEEPKKEEYNPLNEDWCPSSY